MIRKTIKGGIFKPQMIGELEFDQVPEEGSFNPVTSDAVVKAIDEAKEDMQEKIDEVTLDPSAVALGNVHLLDDVTEFPADGCILIDSETNGPGEMSKDTLLELTAQNALAGNVATEFVPNDTEAKAGQFYVYGGLLYVAKEAYKGPWDGSKFIQVSVSGRLNHLEQERADIVNNSYSGGPVSVDLSDRDVVHGVLNSSGEIASAVSYIVTRDIFDVSEFDIIEVTPEANYSYEIAWYSSPDESSYIGITSTTWWSDKTMIRVGGKFMRIQVRYSEGAASLSDITKIDIKGYNRNACKLLQRYLQAKEGYKGDVALDIYRTFVQGAIVGGVYTPTNNSYSLSDYVDVSSFKALELYVNTGYNVYVVFYDSLKNYIQDSAILNGGAAYEIDVSNVGFVRVQIGKVSANTRPGEGINVFVSGVKNENPSVEQTIGVQKLFTENSIVNGDLSPAYSRISTNSFIDISRFGILKVNVQNGYYFGVAFYTSDSVASFKYSTPWLYSDNKDISFDVTKYSFMRLTLRKSDNSSIDRSYGTRVNSCVGILDTACYQYGIQKKNDAKWEYEGDRVSVNPTLDFFNVLPANAFTTSYSFSTYYQQGAAIHNGYAVMFRHHAACSIFDIKTMALVSEFAVTDVAADVPHMNNASFSNDYPTGNTEFPYCFVSRVSYLTDTPDLDFNERNSCYVFNLTTAAATLVQTIKYANTTTKFHYNYCDWVVDRERNRLIAYGRSGSYSCTFLEFALPAIGDSVVQLTDDDILDEWTVDFQFWGHTFEATQGFDVCGRYIFCTYSNPSFGTEGLGIVDKYEHRIVACKEWSNTITDEIQAAATWDGALYIISEGCRIDKIVFN